ncbi:hypothetical protein [uncultured Photobacterium sp.]|uniref:hypothetical protein n=1 Tax=uncultured Photobacterium sp. TaxID=173973 RepID=UPI002625E88B|nr:hypothetical protein [uncultured Photobacterium sp.]
MNKVEAIKAAKNGSVAACISAIMTIIVVMAAINSDSNGKLALWNDPANFIDVVLILVCALGMYKKSRVAAIVIFVYFISAKIIIAIELQKITGLIMGLVFLYFYGKAIQGTFVYHKLEKKENPNYKATNKWMYIFGVPSVIIVVALIGFSLMSTTGVVPSTRVQFNKEVSTSDIAILVSNGVISEGESVEAFYSQGLSSILESGNVLTSKRVVLYWTDENQKLQVYSILRADVADIILESKGSLFEDSVYKVSTENPDEWLKLFLSTEQKGDEKFIHLLEIRT